VSGVLVAQKPQLLVQALDNSPQVLLPFVNSIGDETGEKTGFGFANPETQLASLSYAALFAQRSGGYAWYMNYNSTDFQSLLNTLGSQGLRIEDIDTYGHNIFSFGGTWTGDGLGWAWVLNYTSSSAFTGVLNGWPVGFPRYRPIDFAIHPYLNSTLYYGAVAVASSLGFGWTYNSDQGPLESWIPSQWGSNRRLVELEIYRDPSSGNVKYAAISKDATYPQTYAINVNWTTFLNTHNAQMSLGRRLVEFDKYSSGGVVYYAGLWNGDGVGSGYILNYTNQTTFTQNVNSQIALGRLPIMIDVYDSDELISGISKNDLMQAPNTFELRQNYPNPFNPSTTISFTIPTAEFVTLKVYNVLGKEVAALVADNLAAGSYDYAWQATDLASGIYWYRLSAGDNIPLTGKMILMK
jgi:hypothetical protein